MIYIIRHIRSKGQNDQTALLNHSTNQRLLIRVKQNHWTKINYSDDPNTNSYDNLT